jgi:hypothetical protein
MSAESSEPESQNPYAPSTLYEPAQTPDLQLLTAPIVARGRVTYADRQFGLQMAAWVTAADWRNYLLRSALAIFAVLIIFAPNVRAPEAVVLFTLFVFSIPTAVGLLRMRWARVSARQAEQDSRIVERQIDDRGISAAGAAGLHLTPWSVYYTGRIGVNLAVLVLGPYDAYQIFPRSHFASDNDWTLFTSAVRRYIRHVK